MKKILKYVVCILCLTIFITCVFNVSLAADECISGYFNNEENLNFDDIDTIINESFEDFSDEIINYCDSNYCSYMKFDDTPDDIFQMMKAKVFEVFNCLDIEAKEALSVLREESKDTDTLLCFIENDFENIDKVDLELASYDSNYFSFETFDQLLNYYNVAKEYIIIITGLLDLAINTLKAWFISNKVKVAIITGCILTLTITIIACWDKIKICFNEMVELFISKLKSLANTVINLFETIKIRIYLLQVDETELASAVDINSLQDIREDRIYYISYLRNSRLLQSKLALNYLEAATVLELCKKNYLSLDRYGLNKTGDLSYIQSEIEWLDKLDVNKNKIGIYTDKKIDAAKLAHLFGGIENISPEINGTLEDGYLYHFHNQDHNIHVWYRYS